MESYVWHLVHGLAKTGIEVVVVCEKVFESPADPIRIIQVDAAPERPRWKSMMTFRARVDQKIRAEFHDRAVLIHSHERSLCHQVTTFHGPPIEPPKGCAWISCFNKRISAWQQMERDEVLGPSVQMVLSVSSRIQEQLANRYPAIIDTKVDVAWPGVTPSAGYSSPSTLMGLDQARFVFVGKEWKRKGLDIAIRIVAEFRLSHCQATLTVFGVNQDEIPRSMRALKWMQIRGWSPMIPWLDFDVLLHPARQEPFGMVVAEARSHGVPVLMSSLVGAADLGFSGTRILDVTAPPAEWSQAAAELIETNTGEPELKWSWSDLVAKHIETIYPQVDPVIL